MDKTLIADYHRPRSQRLNPLLPFMLFAPTAFDELEKGISKIKVSQEALYSLCSCGSGQKYKFCCYKKRRMK